MAPAHVTKKISNKEQCFMTTSSQMFPHSKFAEIPYNGQHQQRRGTPFAACYCQTMVYLLGIDFVPSHRLVHSIWRQSRRHVRRSNRAAPVNAERRRARNT